MNEFMQLAKKEAINGVEKGEGGPFGAVIVDENNKIVAMAHNEVLKELDPTSHAEIVAIRKACQKLHTKDLSGCTIYTSCEPCPMCLSAIIWANIKNVYYACTRNDAEYTGFKDKGIYDYLNGYNNIVSLKQIDRDECLEVMLKYKKENKEIY